MNFFKITNSDNRELVVISDYTKEQVQNYYREIGLEVTVSIIIPTKTQVIHAQPLGY